MLKKQNRIYKNYKKNGFKGVDKTYLEQHRNECSDAIEKSLQEYLFNLGDELPDNRTGQKRIGK